MAIRPTAVAGAWYPGTAAGLTTAIEQYLEAAARRTGDAPADPTDLVALVAPHAGLMYSGPVAAHAYRLVARQRFDTIVLIGPSHYVDFEGASVWPAGAFHTPLGDLPIDRQTAQALIAVCPLVSDLPRAHAREHSLEMQLPFLASLAPDTPIVPLVMGRQTRATAFTLADALSQVLGGRRALLIASSDLSHFHEARTAAALDAEVIARVERLDADGLMALLEQRPEHACGGGPIVTVLRAAAAAGATQARVLAYADSGDVSGDKASVVGYLAGAAWR